MITWENQRMGFLFFPIWVRGSAWRPLGAPELRYNEKQRQTMSAWAFKKQKTKTNKNKKKQNIKRIILTSKTPWSSLNTYSVKITLRESFYVDCQVLITVSHHDKSVCSKSLLIREFHSSKDLPLWKLEEESAFNLLMNQTVLCMPWKSSTVRALLLRWVKSDKIMTVNFC